MGLDMYLLRKKNDEPRPEKLIYWRKANQIHKYFCDNGRCVREDVQYMITKPMLVTLLNTCKKVKEESILEYGMIKNGERLTKYGWEPIMTPGMIITNPEIAMKLLPTEDGFFFGSTEYDSYYMEDIEYTIEEISKILEDIGPDEELEYYASW